MTFLHVPGGGGFTARVPSLLALVGVIAATVPATPGHAQTVAQPQPQAQLQLHLQ